MHPWKQPATIHGKRIILRPYRPDDADALWHSIHHEEFNKLTGTHTTFTREMIDNYIQNQIAADDDSRTSFIIALPDDDRALGEVVLNDIDRDNQCANIRIAFFDETQVNKGYGTEAMRLMVDYGFKQLGLHRISLGVYAFNPRAIRVYEKIGFQREGVLRDALHWQGEYIDEVIMSILAHEWQALSTDVQEA